MRWIRGLTDRLHSLLRRGAVEREMDEEMRFHLEMETEKLLRQGRTPEEARREALLRFGGVDRMKERTREERGTRWLEDALRDLRYAARALRLNPGFATVAVGTLALGIGATSTTFSVVDGVLLQPLPWTDGERLVVVRETDDGGRAYFPSFDNFVDLRERSATLDPMIALQPAGDVTVLGAFEPARVPVMGVTRGFPAALGVEVELGRGFAGAEHARGAPAVALVSHAFWRDRLGAPERLAGVTLEMRGRIHDVVGVMPVGFRFFRDAEVWWPAEQDAPPGRGTHAFWVVGRLVPGATLEATEADLDAAMAAMKAEYGDAMHTDGVLLRSLRDELLGEHRRALLLLLGAAGLVLLVACTNVAGTLLARASAREHEMAVRSSMGAGRGRLVRQLLTEALVLGGTATAAGVLMATLATSLLSRLGAGFIPRLGEVGVDGRVLAFTAAVGLLASLLFGLRPAFRLATAPGSGLRAGGRGVPGRAGGPRGMRSRWSVLVGTEVALSVLLLVGSGLLTRSLLRLVSADTGFDPEGVLVAELGIPPGTHADAAERAVFLSSLVEGVRAIPGVETAGIVNLLPTEAFTSSSPVLREDQSWEDWNTGGQVWAGWRVADPGYFEALRIRLPVGRVFDPRLGPEDPGEVVVNRSLARRLWGDADPLGRRIRSQLDPRRREPLTVVGVIEDPRLWSVEEGAQPELFVSWRQRPGSLDALALAVRAEEGWSPGVAGLAAPVRRAIRSLEPRVAVRARPLEDILGATHADRRFVALVLALFAVVGLMVAAAGIYGVVSYSVARRTREIGIRIALGAAPGQVGRAVQARALTWVALGLLAGLAGAFWVSRWMKGLLYEVSPLDPWTYASVVAALAAAALVASWIPARRSTRVDPAVTLRSE